MTNLIHRGIRWFLPILGLAVAISSWAFPHIAQAADGGGMKSLRPSLAAAQKDKDANEVCRIAAAGAELLGDQAGIPEKNEKYISVDPQGPRMTRADLREAFAPYVRQIEAAAWWKDHPSPAAQKYPPRMVASVITGCLAARRAGANESDRLLQIAREAGDYLRWTQLQGGTGVFPFPASRGKAGRSFEVLDNFLTLAEKAGRLSQAVHNDWVVDDLGDGGLNFDNGLCGVSVLELYQATKDANYLRAARAAADWAASRAAVPNWNYNSFSVHLLASVYRETRDANYLAAAKDFARLGICPGQLRQGPRKGRWADPHNACVAYHYIIVRGLGTLASALPEDDADKPRVMETLRLALQARNGEYVDKGVCCVDSALEALCPLAKDFPPGDNRLGDEGRAAALDVLNRYVTAGMKRGKLATFAGPMGLLMETVACEPSLSLGKN